MAYQPIVWSDSLAGGVPEIDEQHQILVQSVNDAAVKLADEANRHLLGKIAQDLLGYALYHFDTEEELMQEYGYQEAKDDAMNQHLEQHKSFTAKVMAIHDELKAGKTIPPGDILQFLHEWLVDHIQKTDMHLGSFIVAKRAAG